MLQFGRDTNAPPMSDVRSAHQKALFRGKPMPIASIADFCAAFLCIEHIQMTVRNVASNRNNLVKAQMDFSKAWHKLAVVQDLSSLPCITFGRLSLTPLVQPAGLRVANG